MCQHMFPLDDLSIESIATNVAFSLFKSEQPWVNTFQSRQIIYALVHTTIVVIAAQCPVVHISAPVDYYWTYVASRSSCRVQGSLHRATFRISRCRFRCPIFIRKMIYGTMMERQSLRCLLPHCDNWMMIGSGMSVWRNIPKRFEINR